MTQLEALQRNGIQRRGSARRGFRYHRPGGGRVSAAERERIRALRIPPAWTEVAITPSARGHLQAVGKDAAGRWQYRYSEAFLERRRRKKFSRLLRFARELPAMRKEIEQGLRGRALDQRRVMACIVRILSTCFIRPGSQVYADEHGAYGLATLLKRHVTVKGDQVDFDFTGKSHQRQHRALKDRRVARVVRALLAEAPGEALFQFQSETGWVDVRRPHINAWIKQVMGTAFSAKDFRTWAGTLICACALAQPDPNAGGGEGQGGGGARRARRKQVVAAIKRTAQNLGNTPAVCKSAYIDPSVLKRFEKGQVLDQAASSLEALQAGSGTALLRSERALLALLERSEPADTRPRPHARSRRVPSARRGGKRASHRTGRGSRRRAGV